MYKKKQKIDTKINEFYYTKGQLIYWHSQIIKYKKKSLF